MKKLFILSTLVSMLFVGCNSFEDKNNTIITCDKQLRAGFADETRTYVEKGMYLRWHEDDRLSAFYGNTRNRQYKFNGKTGDNNGSFSHIPSGDLETGNSFDRIYAVYPYDPTTAITDEGVISLTLPTVQQYAENSFGRGANTMIAVTENCEDTFLAFKNACGYLKLKLYNVDGAVIKSIELKGNNGEKIAGTATATITFGEAPVVTMADDATDTITLDCGAGVTLGTTAETATEFWMVVPETTFENGFYITIIDLSGGKTFIQTKNSISITRNSIQPMSVYECTMGEGPDTWRIYYTTYSGEAIEPYSSTLKAHMVSNTYKEGQGVMKFDCELTEIPAGAFYMLVEDLESITLPSSITSIGKDAFFDYIRGYQMLKYVYMKAETPPILPGHTTSDGTFFDDVFHYKTSDISGNSRITCTIYVPRTSVEYYKSEKTWRWHWNHIEPYDFE